MSTSDQLRPQTVTLAISGVDADSTVTIFDGRDRQVWRDSGDRSKSIEVPRGLYTVRVTRGAAFEETVVRLDDSKQIAGVAPQRFSAAPLAQTATTHEYYSETAAGVSRNPTRKPLIDRQPRDSWLFVFVRAVRKESYGGEDLGKGLEILDENGAVLSDFGPQDAKSDKIYGWLALSARSPAGVYRLRYRGEQPREIALHLYARWQTQVFLMHHERLRFGSLKVLMARDTHGFEPRDEVPEVVDRALEGLQNGTLLLTDSELRKLLRDKFHNPMLGFVGGHALLMRLAANRVAGRNAEKDEQLMRVVLKNLGRLVSKSPDVEALKIAFARYANEDVAVAPLAEPPMLRAGLVALLDAAIERPNLIPEEGLIDRLTERLFADTPWTTWEPFEESGSRRRTLRRTGRSRAKEPPTLNWLQIAVLDEAERQQRKRGQVPRAVEAERLARRLGVTRHAILRAAAEVDTLRSQEFDRYVAEHWEGVAAITRSESLSAFVK